MNFTDAVISMDPISEVQFGKVNYSNRRGLSQTFSLCKFSSSFLLNIYSGKLEFYNCEFDTVEITSEVGARMIFHNCVFKKDVKIEKINPVDFFNCSVSGKLEIGSTGIGRVDISNSITELEIRINEIHIGNALGSTHSMVRLKNLNVGLLKFGSHLPDGISIVNGMYDSIRLIGARNIKNFEIAGQDYGTSMITIDSLEMSDLKLEGEILLKFAQIRKMDMSSFIAKNGYLLWQGVRFSKDSEVFIQHSNLENVQWNGVDFNEAKLSFEWSIFSKIEIANVIWPRKRVIYPNLAYPKKDRPWIISWFFHNYEEEKIEAFSIQREIYRQLKSLSIRNNNRLDALGFYRNEMNVHWTYSRLKGGESWWDQILVFIDRNVSDFGQSYILPLIWLFSVHLLLLLSLDTWNFSYEEGAFWRGAGQYFESINPARKTLEWMGKGYPQVIDFFMRISAGFFIFHFIKASRKFGKV